MQCNFIYFYFSSAILQEIYFKSGQDIYEFFPWNGIIGFSITLIEAFFLGEINDITSKYQFSIDVGFLWLGFALSLVLFTSIAPFFIKRCSASMFNISLVSQIFWSYLVEVMFGEASPKGYVYYIGFVVIIAGIYVFNKYPVIQNEFKDKIISDRRNSMSLREKLIDDNDEMCEREKKEKNFIADDKSETSECSAFSQDKKVNYYRNTSISTKTGKYLNN